MKRYSVVVKRECTESATLTVMAEDEDEAEKVAIKAAENDSELLWEVTDWTADIDVVDIEEKAQPSAFVPNAEAR